MNPAKCDEFDYIHFLIAAQRVFVCTEAARSQPGSHNPPAHDAFTRLLTRKPPDTEALWEEAKTLAKVDGGFLVMDDTTLDKPYARKMKLVHRHWSGKHGRAVSGINLSTLLWSGEEAEGALVPTDFSVYDKPTDGLTKNEHFRSMLKKAHLRGFSPRYVLFDSWYSALENLKSVRGLGFGWMCWPKSNRLANPDGSGNVAIKEIAIPSEGRVVHLKGYGMVKMFRTVARDGGAQHWATSDLRMNGQDGEELEEKGWGIESYHRAIEQCCGIERAQVRPAEGQRNHLQMALRAFLRLETHRLSSGVSWYEAKLLIIREAVRAYLARPLYLLKPSA